MFYIELCIDTSQYILNFQISVFSFQFSIVLVVLLVQGRGL